MNKDDLSFISKFVDLHKLKPKEEIFNLVDWIKHEVNKIHLESGVSVDIIKPIIERIMFSERMQRVLSQKKYPWVPSYINMVTMACIRTPELKPYGLTLNRRHEVYKTDKFISLESRRKK